MRAGGFGLGWGRAAGLLAAVLLGVAVGGCRTAPLAGREAGAALPVGVEVPAARGGLGHPADLSWVLMEASYARMRFGATPWVTTAAAAEQGGGGAGGDLAKQAQNPIASLISVPLQDNLSFGIGPEERTQNVLNIQPVVPVSLGKWTLVNRAIIPLVRQPDPTSAHRAWTGIGDVNLTTFVVPPTQGKVMVGFGPIFLFPTATSKQVGKQQWGLGPSAVVVATLDRWVLGLLVNNIWSLESAESLGGADGINSFLAQYFVNCNLPNGWYLSSAPIITADWNAPTDNQWIVPFGGGVGKIFRIGKQSYNAGVQAYYNVVTPDGGPEWSLRVQLTLLFP